MRGSALPTGSSNGWTSCRRRWRGPVVGLAPQVGRTFAATGVRTSDRGTDVQLRQPAVTARLVGVELPLGTEVQVRLDAVDPAGRTVVFVPAS